MQPTLATFIALILAISGVVFFLIGLRSSSADELTKRVMQYISDAEQPDITTATPVQRTELSGSFRERVLSPAIAKTADLIGRLTPGELSTTLKYQLALAGNPMGLTPRGFYLFRIIFTLLGVFFAFSLLRGSLASGNAPSNASFISEAEPFNLGKFVWSGIALLVLANLPKTWLRRKVRARKMAIVKALPDALDMLSVCAHAGLGFDQSLQRISEHWDTALAKEFGRVVTEIGMGIPRRIALRNIAERLDVTELSSFIAVIIQSDKLGMSITQTLHAQAKQMRIERRFRAQEQARKMPIKMLFPLMLFIFPSMFAVILGPMVPILDQLFDTLLNSAVY